MTITQRWNNIIVKMMYITGLVLYTNSIISIAVSHGYHLFYARIIYFFCCFPNLIGMSCTNSSHIVGGLCFACILLVKYSLIIGLETLPLNFYFYILIDVMLNGLYVFFTYAAYKKKQYVLHNVNTRKVIPKIITETTELCSICLENMEDKLVKTICNHLYHENCLEDWMKRNLNCPLCRESLH